MAISQVNIENLALVLVGAKTIVGRSDATKAARLITSLFETSYRGMMELPVEWKFLRTSAQLSSTTDPVIGQYDYRYLLPAGCLRVIACVDEDDYKTEHPYRREVYVDADNKEHDVILMDEDECFILYIRNRSNVGCWPAWFCRLVALDLAILLCEPLKQDKQKKNQLLTMMIEPSVGWMARAIQANGLEDADTSEDNINLDRGNTEVVDAAEVEEVTKKYVITRS